MATRSIRLSPEQALIKIQKYCAYQERSHMEVRSKLYSYGLYSSEVEELVVAMITEGFLNEERFAKAFAGGKFRMKKWGRVKIMHELKRIGVSNKCIAFGLREIDDRDYDKTLEKILKTKLSAVKETNVFKRRDKVARFAIGKGFEAEHVWTRVMDLIPD